jgi:hypothetical protein
MEPQDIKELNLQIPVLIPFQADGEFDVDAHYASEQVDKNEPPDLLENFYGVWHSVQTR